MIVNAIRDFTGERIGMLTVVEQAEDHVTKGGRHRSRWKCLCDCGRTTYVTGGDLTKGNTKSCGCNKKQFFREAVWKGNQFVDCGDYYIGIDAKGETFTFDKEDYDRVSKITWNVETTKQNYHRVSGHLPSNERVLLHQYIMNDVYIDHKDRNPTNNRRDNLRKATASENASNKGLLPSNKSGVAGVYQRRGKWVASLKSAGSSGWIGTFTNKDDAIRARLQAERDVLKEFAPQQHLFEKYGIEVSTNNEATGIQN